MPVLDCGYIVRRLWTGRHLPAHLRRIPLMGQRVVSPILRRTTITATTSCRTEFFDMARAQWIGQIPADPHQNDLCGEMGPCETDRHRRLPHEIPLVIEGDHTPYGLKGKLRQSPERRFEGIVGQWGTSE